MQLPGQMTGLRIRPINVPTRVIEQYRTRHGTLYSSFPDGRHCMHMKCGYQISFLNTTLTRHLIHLFVHFLNLIQQNAVYNRCYIWKQLVHTFVAIQVVLHPFAGRTRQRRFRSFHCTQERTARRRPVREVPTTALPQCRRSLDDSGRQSSTGPCRCRRRPYCCCVQLSPGSCAL